MKTRAMLRLVPVFSVLLTLSACVGWMPRRKPPTIGDRALPPSTSRGVTSSVSTKAVYGKRDPVTIIAQDRTECTVSEQKYKELAIGERVLCAWRVP